MSEVYRKPQQHTDPRSHTPAERLRFCSNNGHLSAAKFCVINERNLDHLLKVGADWYNNRRGHSGRDHLPPIRDNDAPPTVDLTTQRLICVEELGGHLKSYRTAA